MIVPVQIEKRVHCFLIWLGISIAIWFGVHRGQEENKPVSLIVFREFTRELHDLIRDSHGLEENNPVLLIVSRESPENCMI